MQIEHLAIWTKRPEVLRDYYTRYFGGKCGPVYQNPKKQFRSYFVDFGPGSRLEIMSAPGIPENLNDTVEAQYMGIIHLAFGASSEAEVDARARELSENGFRILEGPRRTGDGYYEFVTLDPDLNRIEVTTGPTSSDPACPDNTPLSLKLIDVDLAICRLSADDPFPEWAGYGELVSLTRSEDELSVVCPSVRVPDGVASEKGWRAFVVEGPLGFELTGILASLTAPLAEQRISVFAISTYDTDYLLVKKEMVREAMLVLGRRCEILSTNEQLGKPEPGAP